MSFVKRLVLGTILVLILTAAVLVTTAERSLRTDLDHDLVRTLVREARLVGRALPPDSLEWQAMVVRLAHENASRITLVDPSGRVRADSDIPADSLRWVPNHHDRPEVREALAGRVGTAVRFSESVGRDLRYVAIRSASGLVVRVAASPHPVDELMRRVRRAMLGAALVAVAIGSLAAFLAGRAITGPLTALAGAARAIAAGSPPRLPHSGIADIDALVQALRQMHQQLADRFAELRREQAESAALVDAMVEGVIAADGRGRIVTANPAARRLLGYPPDQPLPALAELFRSREAREVVEAVLGGAVVEGRQLDKDGRTFGVSARPLPAGGAVLVLHDLTELRRLEAVRRDFVANVSHELKTPLTSISGYAETLLGEAAGGAAADPATTTRFLETILANARRMQRLVDDLLDLSRIESGRWQPHLAPTSVEAVAREAWSGLAERARERDVAFALEVAPEAATLVADRDAFCQILVNLFDNALRHTPSGGRIVCRARPADGGTAVSVADTGSGIGREHLPRIFERFYRADPSRARAAGGTGLGLAIVKHLVEAHHGRVAADSTLGQGTTVTCWFPPA
ncbi:MAG TPA: ATP-binding protein [Gemmatimonadales bacterium]|nr:ATP-binding protein [Gemmatimonadales bacterium]